MDATSPDKLAAALASASKAGFWTDYTDAEKDALLGLTYHAIDDQGGFFTGRHAKTILDLMIKMSRR